MDYEAFFKEYDDFKVKQSEQKSRGLNEYNVFTALLSSSDEVRLHSRFIYSLVNPVGTHYQGTLFLSLFLKHIGLSDCEIDLNLAQVYKEYDNIDLYITDGCYHIIVENKIYAGDQDKQITRYIDTIAKQDKGEDVFNRIYVVYLSLDRQAPSANSIHGYELRDGMLLGGEERQVKFRAVTYRSGILGWLQAMKAEVFNLTNLYQAILQYEDVVKVLYNDYKGSYMTISDFIGKDMKRWAVMDEMANEHVTMLYRGLDDISKKLFKYFTEELTNKGDIEKITVCRKNAREMYSDGVYLNVHMKNKVIIQLEYTMRLCLSKVTVQFFQLQNNKQKQLSFTPKNESQPVRIRKLYEVFCDSSLMLNWVRTHDKGLITQIDMIIDEYKGLN